MCPQAKIDALWPRWEPRVLYGRPPTVVDSKQIWHDTSSLPKLLLSSSNFFFSDGQKLSLALLDSWDIMDATEGFPGEDGSYLANVVGQDEKISKDW